MILRTSSILLLLIISVSTYSQQTRIYTDPLESYHKAKELFQKGQYNLAYPLFRDLQENRNESDYSNYRIAFEEIDYYSIVCGLKQNEPSAEAQAKSFTILQSNQPLQQKMAFQLGEYYFRNQDYRNAVVMYEQTNAENLSEAEIGDMNFHLGYGYFTLKQFDKAKPLLNKVRLNPEDANYFDANYYYGFLAFSDRNYNDALDAFKKVENHPEYGKVVPYYIASIYYQQGKKDEALAYAENALKKSSSSYYDAGLKRMIGQAYFEKKQFSKALPYLESYAAKTEQLSREDIYQLSYSYYDGKQYPKAIDGFKKLTDGQDSLSQSAMYLLGDSYLKTGQKANARNAFSFSAHNSSNEQQREVSLFNYGKLSYELGYQDVAISELRNFLEQYPNSAYNNEARELMVGIMTGTNNYREALDLLESLKNPSPAAKQLYPKVLYGRAMELINDEDLNGANALLDKALKDANNQAVVAPVSFWKGEIAYRQNRLDDAIKYLNNYLAGPAYQSGEVNRDNANYNLGYAYLRKENYKIAQGYFDQVARTVVLNSPDVVKDAYLRSADCAFMNREFSKAKGMYTNAVNYSWPSADYATYQLALIAGVNSSSEKIKLLQSFERKFPTSELVGPVNMEIANSYLADEKFREAIPYLNNVIKSSGQGNELRPKAYLRLGIAQYNLNNNKEALNSYKKLVQEYPNSPEVDEALESARAIYVEEGRTSEYVEFAKASGRSVSTSQQDSLAYASAESKYAGGDQNGAIAAFSSYLQQFPQGQFSIDALYLRSDIYNKRKDFKNAVTGFEMVADRAPNKYAEQASAQAARIYYFELKDYAKAEKYFITLKSVSSNRESRLDAMRGLLRSQYQLKKWEEGEQNANELLNEKSISTDDKVLASMMLGKLDQSKAQFAEAIQQYRNVVNLSKAAYAAEARYEIAASYLMLDDLKNAEKAAFETINKSGSYDFWITKAYILLGDIFYRQKDYFNAKATLQSVVENSKITELKNEAQEKLAKVIADEKAQ
ncbi:MAG TPA: tetratricopeptide repeat protein [Chitinophagaceae bacterium]|nr:tetratricopeptide repeat protein [Chitinophagaceae bacterium]